MTMPLDELAQLLTTRMISGAPVVDEDGEVVGVVSLADLVANAARGQGEAQIASHPRYYSDAWVDEAVLDGFSVEQVSSSMLVMDIMTPVVYVVDEKDTLPRLVDLLLTARVHRAMVTDGDSVTGIVTTMDLIRAIPTLMGVPR
ncbi:MAG: CBS domain-containing protein [Armatimonadetes bacterium]|nr:CBS domain-containing protein [Armatimonadota bacterium]